MPKVILSMITLFFVFMLAGCSSGPSDSEVKSLLEEKYEEYNQQVSMMPDAQIKVDSIEVHECSQSENQTGYICTVTVEGSTGATGTGSETSDVRLVQADSGDWRIVD